METSTKQAREMVRRRPGAAGDAEVLGQICYEAFRHISEAHGFRPDFPSADPAIGLMQMMLGSPHVYSVVAESGDGEVAGRNFLWELDTVSGVGPITIDPEQQNPATGRKLMEDVIRRLDEKGFPSIRLCQATYHNRSLALYTKLGFNTVEPLSQISGTPPKLRIEGYHVRKMTESDLDSVDEVCFAVHGHTRHNEAAAAITMGTAMVVEHDGRITGYTTGIGFFGHTVGESNQELAALIGAAGPDRGTGFPAADA
jgi:GNAT superfamily N-acetyltransferase